MAFQKFEIKVLWDFEKITEKGVRSQKRGTFSEKIAGCPCFNFVVNDSVEHVEGAGQLRQRLTLPQKSSESLERGKCLEQ